MLVKPVIDKVKKHQPQSRKPSYTIKIPDMIRPIILNIQKK
jgi:hypothetical protein